jgi:hypothetical protein
MGEAPSPPKKKKHKIVADQGTKIPVKAKMILFYFQKEVYK